MTDTITLPRATVQQALEALEKSETWVPDEGFGMRRFLRERKHEAAINALKAALEQQEQAEPVAWIEHGLVEAPDGLVWEKRSVGYYTPLYTPPPRREWRGLTDEEIDAIQWHGSPFQFARAIEAAVRSKNHE
jgi:hypothetical protein